LRALISAGSFTTARPAASTSRSEASQASAIAALEVGTLFPPEGQGQLPAPGELPPNVVAPHAPANSPNQSQPPKSIPTTPAAQAPQVLPHTPQVAPHAPQSAGAPQPQHGTPGAITPRAVTPRGVTPAVRPTPGPPNGSVTSEAPGRNPAGSYEPAGWSGGSDSNGQGGGGLQSPFSGDAKIDALQTFSELVPTSQSCGCNCGVCETALVSIVAQVTAAAQVAISSITAIAQMD
jgi:hypothetical protein